MTAQDGTVVWSAQYTAFGEAHTEIETVANNLRFPGQYWDSETGLHYNFHRYYEPRIGRYTSADPIGFAGGSVNVYGYVKNNPLRFVDHRGSEGISTIWEGLEPDEIPHEMIWQDAYGQPFSDSLWKDLIEIFYQENTKILKAKLGYMCPKKDEVITLTPVSTIETCQKCTQDECFKQVRSMVKSYMEWVKQIQLEEWERYGNVLGGKQGGNTRRGGYVDDSWGWLRHPEQILRAIKDAITDERTVPPGGGRVCSDWSRGGAFHLFEGNPTMNDALANGRLCFRGAIVVKTTLVDHEWIGVYGPRKNDLPDHWTDEKSDIVDHVITIDPWPSGGFEISPLLPYYKADQLYTKIWW